MTASHDQGNHMSVVNKIERLEAEIARLKSDLARPESIEVGMMRAEIATLKAERDAALTASRYETDLCGQALADHEAMTAERDALRKDAERYRWLRDSSNWSEDGICPIVASGEDTIYGEHLDQSIDAAMTKEPK
jgi:hypothetical protein